MISHKYKFIFFHVPKAAGTSIIKSFKYHLKDDVMINEDDHELTKWLKETDIIWPNHIPPSYMYYYLNPKSIFNEYFKFAFVRHPYDLLISMYHYAKQKEANIYKISKIKIPDFTKNILESKSFSDWIKTKNFGSPQYDFLRNETGLMVDYIGKTENIQNDINHICRTLKLPFDIIVNHDNRSSHKSWDEYLTKESEELIYSVFQKDFTTFNYDRINL